MLTQISTYTHNTHPPGSWWLSVLSMYSIAAELFSSMIHNRNGDIMAKIVTKLAEKTDDEMADEYSV